MASKLKLDLEQLTIESFDTTRPEKAKGTVFGEQCTCYTNCTCPGCPTCDASCNGTCGEWTCDNSACNGTCDTACETAAISCHYTHCCGSAWASGCNGGQCP